MDINKYPKAKDILRKYIKDRLEIFIETLPDAKGIGTDFLSQEVIDETINYTLDSNLRKYYDFLDGNGIILSVFKDGKYFKYTIECEKSSESRGEFFSRIDAENVGFDDAFKTLNNGY